MMEPAGEGLLKRLQREADAAVLACEATAREQAIALRETAERDAAARRQAALTVRSLEHARARAAAQALAQQGAVRETLLAREFAVTRVMDAMILHANALATHSDLPGMIRADLSRALQYLPDGDVTIRCPASIERLVREAAAQAGAMRATVLVDPGVPLGIIVQSGDGRVHVNATIAQRIGSERPRWAIHIARLLAESFA
ncbi:MAG: hypothetical protein ABMA00_03475 [Gemmatimonas sp.]